AWAVAYDGAGTGATINEFARTTDGGETWTTGQILGGTTYGIGNICGLDANTAYAAVYNGVGNQNTTCGIYKTTNGGTTWTQLPGALQGSASFANNVHFWNTQEGLCHGDVRDGYFEIYTTINGGMTWQRVPQANITGGTAASGEGGWTSVIEAVGDNTIMFGTNKGKVYISDDRGFHWRVTNANITPATNGGINNIAFTDPMNGIVAQTLAPISYRKTSNGGQTWETITPTGPLYTNSLSAIPGSNGIYVSTGAATNETGVSYSLDGGLTWTLFAGTGSKQFLASDFFSNSVGYAGGFNEDQNNGGMFRMVGTLGYAPGAQIVTNPIAVNDTVRAEESDTVALAIQNNGDADLEWTITIDPAATWLSVNTLTGTTPVGESSQIDVIMNAVGLTPSTLSSVIVINNNSVNSPVMNVPVTMIVSSGVKVKDLGIEKHFMIYPNPANDVLNIKGDLQMTSVSLIGTSGNVVMENQVNGTHSAINISNIPAGLYMLRITTSEGVLTSKVNIK
ncbi:MAG: T9SS type A sorting domain-containing protein, partial [Chloroflexota bacterium]